MLAEKDVVPIETSSTHAASLSKMPLAAAEKLARDSPLTRVTTDTTSTTGAVDGAAVGPADGLMVSGGGMHLYDVYVPLDSEQLGPNTDFDANAPLQSEVSYSRPLKEPAPQLKNTEPPEGEGMQPKGRNT